MQHASATHTLLHTLLFTCVPPCVFDGHLKKKHRGLVSRIEIQSAAQIEGLLAAQRFSQQHRGLVSSVEVQLATQRFSQQHRGLVSSIEAQLAAQRLSQQPRGLVSSIEAQLAAQRFSQERLSSAYLGLVCFRWTFEKAHVPLLAEREVQLAA